MPQPVRKYNDLSVFPQAIANHPDPTFTRQFATIASSWATAELEFGRMLLGALHLHAEAALPMYLALRSTVAQQDVVEATVKPHIPKNRIADFDETLKRYRSAGRRRNTIVHGLWGLSKDFPDDLILVDTAEALQHYAATTVARQPEIHSPLIQVKTYKNCMRYSTKDFSNVIHSIMRAFYTLMFFQAGTDLALLESAWPAV